MSPAGGPSRGRSQPCLTSSASTVSRTCAVAIASKAPVRTSAWKCAGVPTAQVWGRSAATPCVSRRYRQRPFRIASVSGPGMAPGRRSNPRQSNSACWAAFLGDPGCARGGEEGCWGWRTGLRSDGCAGRSGCRSRRSHGWWGVQGTDGRAGCGAAGGYGTAGCESRSIRSAVVAITKFADDAVGS
jgi:hypothetical protein